MNQLVIARVFSEKLDAKYGIRKTYIEDLFGKDAEETQIVFRLKNGVGVAITPESVYFGHELSENDPSEYKGEGDPARLVNEVMDDIDLYMVLAKRTDYTKAFDLLDSLSNAA